jgi:hypothetical protein
LIWSARAILSAVSHLIWSAKAILSAAACSLAVVAVRAAGVDLLGVDQGGVEQNVDRPAETVVRVILKVLAAAGEDRWT